MELDFDKEINALLRQTAKQDMLFAENNLQTEHLDADEISVFAENALPEKAKKRLTEHLADCDSCRKSLSELIQFNSEFESEPAKNEATEPVSIEIPWYRKLFIFPGLAYTMGGLVIAFTGLTAFVVLQNFNSESFEMAKSESTSRASNSESEGFVNQSQNANSIPAVSNAASESNIDSTENVAPVSTPESDSDNLLNQRNQKGPSAVRDLPADPTDDELGRRENKLDAAKPISPPTIVSESKPTDKTVSDREMADSAISSDAPAPKPETKTAARKNEELSKKERVLTARGGEMGGDEKKDSKLKSLGESRKADGKTFNKRDGVWYDSAYKNQQTENVRRGTNEYRNLDSGLRAIAEKFTETVVVVWEQTAYRIQ
jgi:hypothetical protein